MVAFRPDLACFGGRPDAVLKHVSSEGGRGAHALRTFNAQNSHLNRPSKFKGAHVARFFSPLFFNFIYSSFCFAFGGGAANVYHLCAVFWLSRPVPYLGSWKTYKY